MDILFFSHYFPPEVNAPASRTWAHCRRWVEAGHRVTVVTGAPNCPDGVIYPGYRNRLYAREVVAGIEVIRVWTLIAPNRGVFLRTANYLSYLLSALLATVGRQRPDIIISTSPQVFCGLAGLLLGRWKRVPAILEVRDLWPDSIAAVQAIAHPRVLGLLHRLEGWMYRQADHIVTVGEGYREGLLKKSVPLEKISVIMNGVDREAFSPRPPDPVLLERLGLSGKTICGYLGTIGLACGLATVLEAAEILTQRGREDLVFLLVGSGAIREELEEESRRRGLKNVVFIGQVPRDQIPAYLSICSVVLVHLKRTELFTTVLPSKIFEAAGMGRPIICGVAGQACQLVEDAGAGVAIEPENAIQLPTTLEELADQSDRRQRLGEAGSEVLAPAYDRDRLAAEFLELLLRWGGKW